MQRTIIIGDIHGCFTELQQTTSPQPVLADHHAATAGYGHQGGAGLSEPQEEIRFYSVSDEYGCFSNFAPYPIRLKGVTWSTSEHYFQAQKFAGTEYESAIRRAKSPAIAARMGRSRKVRLRRDWGSVKVTVMHAAVLAKFSQHTELRAILLATGDARLVEHTERDDYWGDGGDGHGRNELGRILMQVRDHLRREQQKNESA